MPIRSTFAPPGTSRSRKMTRRRLSWLTRAMPRPCRARTAAATELLPDPEFPRKTISRVDSPPTLIGPTLAPYGAQPHWPRAAATAGLRNHPCPQVMAMRTPDAACSYQSPKARTLGSIASSRFMQNTHLLPCTRFRLPKHGNNEQRRTTGGQGRTIKMRCCECHLPKQPPRRQLTGSSSLGPSALYSRDGAQQRRLGRGDGRDDGGHASSLQPGDILRNAAILRPSACFISSGL